MNWSVILGILAAALLVARFVDEHYSDPKNKSRIRSVLAERLIKLDQRMSSTEAFYEAASALGILVGYLAWGLLFAAVYLFAGEDAAVVLAIILAPITVLLALLFTLTAPLVGLISLLLVLYGAGKWVAVHILRRSTDPSKSPYSYLISMAAVAVGIAKAAIEVHTWLESSRFAQFNTLQNWLYLAGAIALLAALAGISVVLRSRIQRKKWDTEDTIYMKCHLPELLGKDIIQSLRTVNSERIRFQSEMPPEACKLFAVRLEAKLSAYKRQNRRAPFWLSLAIQREIECDYAQKPNKRNFASETTSSPRVD